MRRFPGIWLQLAVAICFVLLIGSCKGSVAVGANLENEECEAAAPWLSDLNILLPLTNGSTRVRYRIFGHGGCFEWNTRNNDVIVIEPEYNGTDDCSTSAIITQNPATALPPGRHMAIVEAEEVFTRTVLQCDVYLDRITHIKLFHHSLKLWLGYVGKIYVQAFDAQENVFSTLEGIEIAWSIDELWPQGAGVLVEVTVASCLPSERAELPERLKAARAGMIQVRGSASGKASVAAALKGEGLAGLSDALTITVVEPIFLEPHAPRSGRLCVLPGAAVAFSVHLSQKDNAAVAMPSAHYKWSVDNSSVASIDADSGLVSAVAVGSTKVRVTDTRMDDHFAEGTLHVCAPVALSLSLHAAAVASQPPSLSSPSSVTAGARRRDKGSRVAFGPQLGAGADGRWYLVEGRDYLVEVNVTDANGNAILLSKATPLKLYLDNAPTWAPTWATLLSTVLVETEARVILSPAALAARVSATMESQVAAANGSMNRSTGDGSVGAGGGSWPSSALSTPLWHAGEVSLGTSLVGRIRVAAEGEGVVQAQLLRGGGQTAAAAAGGPPPLHEERHVRACSRVRIVDAISRGGPTSGAREATALPAGVVGKQLRAPEGGVAELRLPWLPGTQEQVQLVAQGGCSASFDWSSTNKKVLSVTGQGMLSAFAAGHAYVSVASHLDPWNLDKVSARATPPARLVLPSDTIVDLAVGETLLAAARLLDDAGALYHSCGAADALVHWHTSNANVARALGRPEGGLADAMAAASALLAPSNEGKHKRAGTSGQQVGSGVRKDGPRLALAVPSEGQVAVVALDGTLRDGAGGLWCAAALYRAVAPGPVTIQVTLDLGNGTTAGDASPPHKRGREGAAGAPTGTVEPAEWQVQVFEPLHVVRVAPRRAQDPALRATLGAAAGWLDASLQLPGEADAKNWAHAFSSPSLSSAGAAAGPPLAHLVLLLGSGSLVELRGGPAVRAGRAGYEVVTSASVSTGANEDKAGDKSGGGGSSKAEGEGGHLMVSRAGDGRTFLLVCTRLGEFVVSFYSGILVPAGHAGGAPSPVVDGTGAWSEGFPPPEIHRAAATATLQVSCVVPSEVILLVDSAGDAASDVARAVALRRQEGPSMLPHAMGPGRMHAAPHRVVNHHRLPLTAVLLDERQRPIEHGGNVRLQWVLCALLAPATSTSPSDVNVAGQGATLSGAVSGEASEAGVGAVGADGSSQSAGASKRPPSSTSLSCGAAGVTWVGGATALVTGRWRRLLQLNVTGGGDGRVLVRVSMEPLAREQLMGVVTDDVWASAGSAMERSAAQLTDAAELHVVDVLQLQPPSLLLFHHSGVRGVFTVVGGTEFIEAVSGNHSVGTVDPRAPAPAPGTLTAVSMAEGATIPLAAVRSADTSSDKNESAVTGAQSARSSKADLAAAAPSAASPPLVASPVSGTTPGSPSAPTGAPVALSGKHIVVCPVGIGTTHVLVRDNGLQHPSTATGVVTVADVAALRVLLPAYVTVRLGAAFGVPVEASDTLGRAFSPDQVAFMRLTPLLGDAGILEPLGEVAAAAGVGGLEEVPEGGMVVGAGATVALRAAAVGTTFVRASVVSAQGLPVISEPIQVVVYPPLGITPSELILGPGGEYGLVCHGGPKTGALIRFTSSDPSVVLVDPLTGMVTAVTQGAATVTAHASGPRGESYGSASASITVRLIASARIDVRGGKLVVGRELTLTVTGEGGAGEGPFTFAHNCRNYRWSVGAPDVLRLMEVATGAGSLGRVVQEEDQDGDAGTATPTMGDRGTPLTESAASSWGGAAKFTAQGRPAGDLAHRRRIDGGFSARVLALSPGLSSISVTMECAARAPSVARGVGKQPRPSVVSLVASESVWVLPELSDGCATMLLPTHFTTPAPLPQLLPRSSQTGTTGQEDVAYSLMQDCPSCPLPASTAASQPLLTLHADGRVSTGDASGVACVKAADTSSARAGVAGCFRVAPLARLSASDRDALPHEAELSLGADTSFELTLADEYGTPFLGLPPGSLLVNVDMNNPNVILVSHMQASGTAGGGRSGEGMAASGSGLLSISCPGTLHLQALAQGTVLLRLSLASEPRAETYLLIRVGEYVHPQSPVVHLGGRIQFTVGGAAPSIDASMGLPGTTGIGAGDRPKRGAASRQAMSLGDADKVGTGGGVPPGAAVPGATTVWDSTDPSVLVIDPNTGLARAVGLGNATVHFRSHALKTYTHVAVVRVASVKLEPVGAPHHPQAAAGVGERAPAAPPLMLSNVAVGGEEAASATQRGHLGGGATSFSGQGGPAVRPLAAVPVVSGVRQVTAEEWLRVSFLDADGHPLVDDPPAIVQRVEYACTLDPPMIGTVTAKSERGDPSLGAGALSHYCVVALKSPYELVEALYWQPPARWQSPSAHAQLALLLQQTGGASIRVTATATSAGVTDAKPINFMGGGAAGAGARSSPGGHGQQQPAVYSDSSSAALSVLLGFQLAPSASDQVRLSWALNSTTVTLYGNVGDMVATWSRVDALIVRQLAVDTPDGAPAIGKAVFQIQWRKGPLVSDRVVFSTPGHQLSVFVHAEMAPASWPSTAAWLTSLAGGALVLALLASRRGGNQGKERAADGRDNSKVQSRGPPQARGASSRQQTSPAVPSAVTRREDDYGDQYYGTRQAQQAGGFVTPPPAPRGSPATAWPTEPPFQVSPNSVFKPYPVKQRSGWT